MNRTRIFTCLCAMVLSVLFAGCGGSNSGNATISGVVSGLATGTSVTLADNGADNIVVSANGGFSFRSTVGSGSGYNVTVATQPTGESCLISYGSGVIDYAGDSIGNVTVNCSANASIGVVADSLASGQSVVFELTLANDPANIYTATATTAGTVNEFTSAASTVPVTLPLSAIYSVTISHQPATQSCALTTSGTTGVVYSPASGGVVNSTPITVHFTCS